MAKKIDYKKYGLPAYQDPPEYQVQVDEIKGTLIGLETSELARRFKMVKLKKKGLEEEISEANLELAALSQLLVERLKDQEIQKVTLAAGGTLYLKVEIYPSTKDRALLQNWVISEEMMEVLTVNYRTLQGIIKERLEAGQAPPPGVEVFLKTTAHLIGAME